MAPRPRSGLGLNELLDLTLLTSLVYGGRICHIFRQVLWCGNQHTLILICMVRACLFFPEAFLCLTH